MQNLKLIIPFLIISSILSFQTLKFEDNIPNLLSTPENIKAQIINKLREEAQKYIFEYHNSLNISSQNDWPGGSNNNNNNNNLLLKQALLL